MFQHNGHEDLSLDSLVGNVWHNGDVENIAKMGQVSIGKAAEQCSRTGQEVTSSHFA